MRVIAGTARGRRLTPFQGSTIRPTPDRVREAIFSKLLSRIGSLTGLTALDLYAGSGAMGIEALSRGAETASFVDQSPQAIETIRSNLDICRLSAQARIHRADIQSALQKLSAEGPFDLVFMDPPYGQALAEATLKQLAAVNLLTTDGIISVETGTDEAPPTAPDAFVCIDTKRYGSTTIRLYQKARQEN